MELVEARGLFSFRQPGLEVLNHMSKSDESQCSQ